nr:hypothetical protein [Streptomyces sp. B1I3]
MPGDELSLRLDLAQGAGRVVAGDVLGLSNPELPSDEEPSVGDDLREGFRVRVRNPIPLRAAHRLVRRQRRPLIFIETGPKKAH